MLASIGATQITSPRRHVYRFLIVVDGDGDGGWALRIY
jgi:hypothetical protein